MLPDATHGRKSWQQNPVHVALISILLIIPCFWQSRIQAGDLSSHIYNAWLTIQIQHGMVKGFWIARQHTNIALDLLFNRLLPWAGVNAAQHIAIPFFVLVFSWGTFVFICTVTRKISLEMMIFIVLLAYGFVFHLGLFNFYFSAGVCFWFLGLTWNGRNGRTLLACPLLLIAWLGHPLPVLWTVGAFFYKKFLGKMSAWLLFILCLFAIMIARVVIMHFFPSIWEPAQISMFTGADQVFLYGERYVLVMALLALIWASMLRNFAHKNTWHALFADPTMQLFFLTAFTLSVFPRSILFDVHLAPLTYLPERLSLFCGVLICALAAKTTLTLPNKTLLVFTAALFFFFCYQDDRKLNHIEDQISAAVNQLSTSQRVIFVQPKESTRLPMLTHMIDRACINHCFSYANYEPSSGHFRLHMEPNTLIGDYWTLQSLQQENYFVKVCDLPLYQVVPTVDATTYKIVQLQEGQRITSLGITN